MVSIQRTGPPRRRHDAEPHRRIRIAGLRIVPALDRRVIRNVIDQRVLGNGAFVELQKRNVRRVGAPPVAAVIAAAVQLFGIDPVERAVQQLCAAIRRQRSLAGGAPDARDEKIVVLDERDAAAVGAERRLELRRRQSLVSRVARRGRDVVDDRDRRRS